MTTSVDMVRVETSSGRIICKMPRDDGAALSWLSTHLKVINPVTVGKSKAKDVSVEVRVVESADVSAKVPEEPPHIPGRCALCMESKPLVWMFGKSRFGSCQKCLNGFNQWIQNNGLNTLNKVKFSTYVRETRAKEMQR